MSITVTPRNSRESGSSGRIVRLILIGVAFSVALGLSFASIWAWSRPESPRLASKDELEALILERISLHEQLSTTLARVDDVATAKETSAEAKRRLKQIAANLRKIKLTKESDADTDALKKQYQAAQEVASKRLASEFIRISTDEDAWQALDVRAALKELDREEKSIPSGPSARPVANQD